uniref:Uncharacterized protein n=1 Tax=Romanomermis culicivorax TaxID=13658 RepID=A0A915IP98_ROMCU
MKETTDKRLKCESINKRKRKQYKQKTKEKRNTFKEKYEGNIYVKLYEISWNFVDHKFLLRVGPNLLKVSLCTHHIDEFKRLKMLITRFQIGELKYDK